MSLAVLVPVLGRPHRVRPTLESFRSTAECHVLFIADPEDEAELAALDESGADHIVPGGTYASKIRAGVRATTETMIFTAADDLEPLPGWFAAASAALVDGVQVVGVNDLIDRDRDHATHFLMTREYAEQPCIDGAPGPFYEGYVHWWCDDELIATAKHRGVYTYAPAARVRHLHPIANLAEDDPTYIKGRERRRQDHRLFRQRRHLWA